MLLLSDTFKTSRWLSLILYILHKTLSDVKPKMSYWRKIFVPLHYIMYIYAIFLYYDVSIQYCIV